MTDVEEVQSEAQADLDAARAELEAHLGLLADVGDAEQVVADADVDEGLIPDPIATLGAPWSQGISPVHWVPGSSMHATNQDLNVQIAGTATTGSGAQDHHLGVSALTGVGLLAAAGLVLRRRHTISN
ncbi:hypothetical protein [Kocuria sp. U4B]